MFFNHDKASLRLNVLLEARRLVGAVMKNPALDRAPEEGPKSGPKIGCAHSGLSCKWAVP